MADTGHSGGSRGAWAFCLAILVSACGGGGMAEHDPEAGFEAESTPVGETATAETTGTAEPEPSTNVDAAAYEREVAAALQQAWTPPGRDSNTPPRIAVVTVELGDDGSLESWTWRRRSPQGPFNDSIAEHLDQLVDASARAYPLPPEGSPERDRVLQDGVAIEFADE